MTLTKEDVVDAFYAEVLPAIPAGDMSALRAHWVQYLDELHRNGNITDAQANWVCPHTPKPFWKFANKLNQG